MPTVKTKKTTIKTSSQLEFFTPVAIDEMRKPHEMVVMVAKEKKLSVVSRKIYYGLMKSAQDQMEKIGGMPAADFLFSSNLRALMSSSGVPAQTRTLVKTHLREMLTTEVVWESTVGGDGLKFLSFSLLSEVALTVKNNESYVSWAFPPTIMSLLRDPSKWSNFNLAMLAKLDSYAAIALYDICARYKDNPGGITCRQPVDWWLDGLSPIPRNARKQGWRKFKSGALIDAVRNVSEVTDMEVDLVEYKSGLVTIDAQFAITRKKPTSSPAPNTTETESEQLQKLAATLGVNQQKFEELLLQAGLAKLADGLNRLQSRAARTDLPKIENSVSYLRPILEASPIEEQASSSKPLLSNASPIADTPNPFYEQQKLKNKQESLTISKLKIEIQSLDEEIRAELVSRAIEDLSANGHHRAPLVRKAAQGNIFSGILGAHLVKIYALKHHGENWRNTSA